MNNKVIFFNLGGILAFIIFSGCTLISMLFYPHSFSPLYNWLSNLGNYYLNPAGAIFFNMGCILTGIILIPFSLNLYRWKPGLRYQRIFLILAIIIGVFASLSLVGVGVFSQTHEYHVLVASGVFVSIFILITSLSIALFKHPKFMRIVMYWGLFAILSDVIFILVIGISRFHTSLVDLHPTVPVPGLEWSAVYASLIWIAALSYNMHKKQL